MDRMKNFIVFTAVFAACLWMTAAAVFAGVVVIDPGHGGPGTEGAGAIYPPYMEKSLTLDLATKLRDELAARGVSVYMTRTSDVAMSLPQRASYAKSVGANLLVSIHFNASGPHDKTGCEVWSSMYGNHATVGRECGAQVLSQLTALGLESKGIKSKLGTQGDYFGIIRYGVSMGVPTIIIEHCFIDYPTDRSVLESAGTAGMARADAAGIASFLASGTGQALMNGTLDVSPVAPAPTVSQAGGTVGAGASSTAAAVKLSANFSPADWNWLLSQWAYTGHPQDIIVTVPLSELQALVEEHKKGNI